MVFKDPPVHDMFTKRSEQLAIRVSPEWLSWWKGEFARISEETGLNVRQLYLLLLRELEKGTLRQVERQAHELVEQEQAKDAAASRR